MSKVEHNEENIEKLATEVTDAMDMDCLVQYFYEGQYEYYKNDREAFEEDWRDMMGDVDE